MALDYLLLETTGKVLQEDGTSGVLLESSFLEPRPIRINTSQGWADIGDATSFVSGTGTPTAAVGATGAIYLDVTSGLRYGPKAGGAWPGTPIAYPASTPADATTSAKGIVQLAGDLAGTAALPQLKVPYGTSLPASPADGQEAILVDSVTNPSYQWRFRYNAGSSSAYKWELVGGDRALVAVDAAETITPASTWTEATSTAGPLLVVPRAGDYDVTGGAIWGTAPADVLCQLAPWKGTTTQGREAITQIPASHYGSIVCSDRLTGCAAGSDVRLRYWANTGSAVNVQKRWLEVTPVRVS